MTASLQGIAPGSPEAAVTIKAQALALELRTLQDRLNDTINQLCELVAHQTVTPVQAPLAHGRFVPDWLRWPQPLAWFDQPPSGQPLSTGTTFYTNGRAGLWQIVQQPLARHRGTGFALGVNFSQFDGEWMSVVFDASALLKNQPAGRVRLDLVTEVTGSPLENLSVRCVWRGHNHDGELPFDVQLNKVTRQQAEIDYLDPELTRSLEVHLVLSVPARGAVELQRLTLDFTVLPGEATLPAPMTDVFGL